MEAQRERLKKAIGSALLSNPSDIASNPSAAAKVGAAVATSSGNQQDDFVLEACILKIL